MAPAGARRRVWGMALVLLGALALASCSGSSGAASATATEMATATAPATSTPSPTSVPTITKTPGAPVNCATSDLFSGVTTRRIGDLLVTQVGLFTLAYPGRQVPDNTPLKPLYVGNSYDGNLATNPLTNPNDAYDFWVCNAAATQSHTLSGVNVRIASLTPYTGQLNEWLACKSAHSRSGSGPTGCGGSDPRDETLQAAFTAGAQAGASAMMSQEDWNAYRPFGFEPAQMGPLPIALAPGNGLVLSVDVRTSGASGTYAFSFGIAVDGASAAQIGTGEQVLLAPVAHTWTGAACTTAAMQAQIPPATNPPSYYICPMQ